MQNESASLSLREKTVPAIFFLAARTLTGTLSKNQPEIGNAQYLSMLISTMIGVGVALLVLKICSKANAPLLSAARLYIGRFSDKIIALLLIFALLISARNTVFSLSSAIVNVSLPGARLSTVSLLAIITACIAAFIGVKAISRFSLLLLPAAVISLFAIFLMCAKSFNLDHIFPILGFGAGKTLLWGAISSSDFLLVLILGDLYDPAAGASNNKKALLYPPLIAGGISVLIFGLGTLIFPYTFSSSSPLFSVLSLVSVSEGLKALGSLFSFIASAIFLISISLHICFLTHLTIRIMPNLKNKILPCAFWSLLILILSISDIRSFPRYLSFLFDPPDFLPLVIYIPIISVFTATLIKKRRANA